MCVCVGGGGEILANEQWCVSSSWSELGERVDGGRHRNVTLALVASLV